MTKGKELNKEKESKKVSSVVLASKVKRALTIQGFPLEVSTYRSFKEREWDAELEASFADIPQKPGQEAREWWKLIARRGEGYQRRFIDVKAEKHLYGDAKPYSFAEIGVIVECKSHQTIPWVFYEEEKVFSSHERLKHLSFGDLSSFSLRSGVAAIEGSKMEMIRATSHHTAYHHQKIAQAGHIVPLSGGDKGRDTLYEACMTCVAALEYYYAMSASTEDIRFIEHGVEKRTAAYWTWYPVVVFAGNMFSICFADDGDFEAVPTDYIQLRFDTGIRHYWIDIVQNRFLPKFIEILDDELARLKAAITSGS